MKKKYSRPSCKSIAIPTQLPLAASGDNRSIKVNEYESGGVEELYS